MKYTLREIINSRNDSKKYIDKIDIWVFYVVRPISNIFTFVFLKFDLTANEATLISTIMGLIGAMFLIFSKLWITTFLGLVILNLWIIFDCIDGNIARTTKTKSKLGEYFDALSGYFYVTFLYFSLGINVFNHYSLFINGNNYNWIYLCIGALTSIACIFPRLSEHKAKLLFPDFDSNITDKFSYSLIYILGLNIAGMAGVSNPIMIIFFLIGRLNLYLVFYFVVQTSIAIYTIFQTIHRLYTSNY